MIILLYFTALLNALLGLYTFFATRKSLRTLFFLFISIGIAGWAVSNALFQEAKNSEEMYVWAVIAYQVAAFLLYSVNLFSYEAVRSLDYIKGKGFLAELLALLIGLFLPLFRGLAATGVDFEKKAIVGGPLLPLLFVSYIFLMYRALSRINKARKKLLGMERTQINFVYVGLFGAITAGLITNVILPAFGIYAAVTVGPSFTLFFLGAISYSILRHRLFDTRVLVGRITYYLLLGAFTYIFFYAVSTTYNLLFEQGIYSPPAMLMGTIVSVMFVVGFNEINRYIRTQVTSRLINPGYDPLETNDALSSQLSLIVDLNQITTTVNDVISKTIRPDSFWLYLKPSEDKIDRIFFHEKFPELQRLVELTKILWNGIGKHPVVLDEFKIEMLPGGLYVNYTNIIKEIEQIMVAQKAKVLLSLDDSEGIIGFYAFGSKEADSPYTSQDIDFIISLANTTNLAVNRSLLYAEVQDFADSLQEKVDIATADLKASNLKLESALKEIQDARRKERDMIDVMGHELRTPISIVRNALRMLDISGHKNKDVIDPATMRKYLDMSLESTRREIALIETLLSATKLDASRVQLTFTAVDAKDVINDALEGQRQQIIEKKLQINYAEPKDELNIFVDRTRVQEIMDNFLSNAVKYTPKGSVTLKLWGDEEKVWFSVEDTGMGIAADDLQHLGKKFFRAKQYLSDSGKEQIVRPGGTGLGLYVTFELIRLLGGTLYINSQVGKGTKFTFGLPRHKGEPDKQIDQTFDAPEEANLRTHIIINGVPPMPK